MPFFSGLLSKLASAVVDARGVLPLVEKPDGEAVNWQGDENGVPYVNIGGLDESSLATSALQTAGNVILTASNVLLTTGNGLLTAGNVLLTAIRDRLPATLGAKLTAESLAVALPTDLQPFKIETPGPAMTTLRTLVTALADTEPPTDASAWVAMAGAGHSAFLHIPIAGAITAVDGTVKPTQVTLRVWSRLGATGAIDKVYEQTYDATRLILPAATNPYRPLHIPFNAPDALVTVTFEDGTAPTITGVIKGRMVSQAGVTSKDLPIDVITRALRVMILGYDSPTDTVKTADSIQPCDRYLDEALGLNEASKAAGTYNFPSDDGTISGEHGRYAVEIDVTAPAGCTITLTPQATMRDTWAAPKDVSKAVYSTVTGANLAGPIVVAAGTSYSSIWIFGAAPAGPCSYRKVRVNYVIADVASGALVMSSRKATAQ